MPLSPAQTWALPLAALETLYVPDIVDPLMGPLKVMPLPALPNYVFDRLTVPLAVSFPKQGEPRIVSGPEKVSPF